MYKHMKPKTREEMFRGIDDEGIHKIWFSAPTYEASLLCLDELLMRKADKQLRSMVLNMPFSMDEQLRVLIKNKGAVSDHVAEGYKRYHSDCKRNSKA